LCSGTWADSRREVHVSARECDSLRFAAVATTPACFFSFSFLSLPRAFVWVVRRLSLVSTERMMRGTHAFLLHPAGIHHLKIATVCALRAGLDWRDSAALHCSGFAAPYDNRSFVIWHDKALGDACGFPNILHRHIVARDFVAAWLAVEGGCCVVWGTTARLAKKSVGGRFSTGNRQMRHRPIAAMTMRRKAPVAFSDLLH